MIYVESVTLSPSGVSLTTGNWYHNASIEVYPSNADCMEVTWHSENTSVATVNAYSGHIYPKSPGTARIYATATNGSGYSDYLMVYVSDPACVESVTLDYGSISLVAGESTALHACACPVSAKNRSVNWHSSNSSVATVSDGVVTAVSQGNAIITATAADGSGCSASCYVTVSYLVDQLTGVQTFSYREDGNKYLSKNFKVSEFQCKDGSDEILIDMKLVKHLQAIRDWAGASITITSGYRTPTHNASVGGASNSRHIHGMAADIVCSGKSPLQLAQQAQTLEVQGIEWNKDLNYTHIDTRTTKWHVKYENGAFSNVSSFYNVN